MGRFNSLMKEYLQDRKKALRREWFTAGSWFKRLNNRTRSKELGRLLAVESSFNTRWLEKIQGEFSDLENREKELNKAVLDIKTHMKKQNSRSFFLVVYGAVVVAIFTFVDVDFSILLFLFGFVVAGERLIVNETVGALEELQLMVEYLQKT